VEGLKELDFVVNDRVSNYFRNKKIPRDPFKKKELPTDQYKWDFDHTKPLKIHSPVLAGSYQDIVQHYENPEVLINQITEKRKQAVEDKLKEKEERKKKMHESLYDDNAALEKRRLQIQREKKARILKEKNKKKLELKKAESRRLQK
jgi:hypothetical protein